MVHSDDEKADGSVEQMSGNRRERARLMLVVVLASIATASGLVAAGLITPGGQTSGSSLSPATGPGEPAGDAGHDHSDHDHHHASDLSTDGRFSGPGGVWPPEPRNATDVVALDFPGEQAPVDADLVPAEVADERLVPDARPLEVALADRAVIDALGDRYQLIAASDGAQLPEAAKGQVRPDASRIAFYSLTFDQSVDVLVVGREVRDLTVQPATEYQPPLSEKEKYRAAELARAHWEAAGDTRLDQLEAFVMLDMADNGSFHPSRVAYVTFHAELNARPELLTWIDLSSEQVIRAEVDR